MDSKMWKLHAIIIKKQVPKKEAEKHAEEIAKNSEPEHDKLKMRVTGDSYRYDVFNKKLFNAFRTKILNDNISLIFGKLIKEDNKDGEDEDNEEGEENNKDKKPKKPKATKKRRTHKKKDLEFPESEESEKSEKSGKSEASESDSATGSNTESDESGYSSDGSHYVHNYKILKHKHN